MINNSAIKKNSYMFSGASANLSNSMQQALMIPASHKRRSGYKLSLLSGGGSAAGLQGGCQSLFRPKNTENAEHQLLLSGSKYEDSSMSSLSSSAKKHQHPDTGSSSGFEPTNNSSNASAYKMGSGMLLYPHISVDEESSDSEEGEDCEE